MPFVIEVRSEGAFGKWEPDLDRVYKTSQEAHDNCGKGEIVAFISDKTLRILEYIRGMT